MKKKYLIAKLVTRGRIENLIAFFWGVAIFLLPFNVFLVFWQPPFAIQGSFNIYENFVVYASELFIFLAFILWVYEWARGKIIFSKNERLILEALIIVFFVGLFDAFKVVNFGFTLLHLFPFLATIMVIWFMVKQVLPVLVVKKIFVASMSLQAILVIIQIFLQESLGVFLLGEPLIGKVILGTAKIVIGDQSFIRAYGTFPHSNLLAGYALVAFFYVSSFFEIQKSSQYFWRICQVIIAIAFLMAYSEAALLGLLIALFLTKKIKIYQGIFFLFVLVMLMLSSGHAFWQQQQVQDRVLYAKISVNMLWHIPQGVGLAQFTDRMAEFSPIKLKPWQFQPVHNIYLLLVNEWGINWGILVVVGIGYFIRRYWFRLNSWFLVLLLTFLVIGFFDHYLLSLYQGLMLTGLLIGQVIIQVRGVSTKLR